MSRVQDAVGEVVGNESLVVVREHQSIDIFQRANEQAQQLLLHGWLRRLPALMIDANDC